MFVTEKHYINSTLYYPKYRNKKTHLVTSPIIKLQIKHLYNDFFIIIIYNLLEIIYLLTNENNLNIFFQTVIIYIYI